MRGVSSALMILLSCTITVQGAQDVWAYPCKLTDTYNSDCVCRWHGITEDNEYGDDIYVIPEALLIGAPPSEYSAVTITTDHWIEVGFPGPLSDGSGPDLVVQEMGRMGESALVLLSNGRGRTYPIGIATALDTSGQLPTDCTFDLQGLNPGFAPTAVRIVSQGLGGESPGFDVASVRARIEVDTTRPHLPIPCNGAQGVSPDASLQWQNTLQNDQIGLYVGQDPELMNDPNQPFAVLPGDANSFTPSTQWTLGETYFWRVASINTGDPNHPAMSDIWRFTVTDSVILDDFESYQSPSDLQTTWYYVSMTLYLAQCRMGEPVYAGCQSANLQFATPSNAPSYLYYDYDTDQDWAQAGPTHLEFLVQGKEDYGTPHRLYCWINDHHPRAPVYCINDPNQLNDGQWHRVRIPLSEFVGVDLTQIRQIGIGLESADPTGSLIQFGLIYIDDLRLYRGPASLAFTGDLNRDKHLTYEDVGLFAEAWCRDTHSPLAISEPNDPLCRFSFDGNLNDAMNRVRASSHGLITYPAGYLGEAVSFDEPNATVDLLKEDIEDVIHDLKTGITIAFWQLGTDSSHRNDTLMCSNYIYAQQEPQLAISLGLWNEPEQLNWICGTPWNPANRLEALHQVRNEWTGQWNHWVFTKDFRTGLMTVYLNGRLHSQHQGLPGSLSPNLTLTLGAGWYGYYDGQLDEFRLYDYALNEKEAAYLATQGTGQSPIPVLLPWDFNHDGSVNLLDFAILAQEWELAHGTN